MKIVITDLDQDRTTEEEAVAEAAGVQLVLQQARTEDEVIASAQGADGLLVQYAPITDRVLEALPTVRAIGRYGVGVDTIDLAAATARGVAVSNVPDYGTDDVSDHAVALAVTLSRGIVELDRNLREGTYSLAPVKPLHRLSTRTFGVVGLGRIGAATARKARALGFSVQGCDPMREPGTTTEDGIAVRTRDEVLSTSDVLSIHVPLTEDTRHLITTSTLARMRPGSLLVNTSRGGVVDTDAVVEALRSGHLGGAGLDVFETEPLPVDSPLRECPTAVLTPHASWYSEESETELKRRVIENVVEVLAGRTPRNILNPEVLGRAAD
ncbi:C-terminal binding protein [Brachybacterium fresconis]|uniref:D-3-phosphoglycerate dehydrogenase n=1 Tax=Brachybacterium fresconis TaxID=173363 RepID=A0ABS4YE97_9MICO|nr:C-terminal binding protein [Brachybacterium fresconis]MBP2407124.1 D-3-phosphoglycerate dehydrogenase [Brachybacterium fresconis]